MKYVACTSVVPFKVVPAKELMYSRSFKQDNTFMHCWKMFAEDIISLSKTKIIVLVGNEVKEAFEKSGRFQPRKLALPEEESHKYKIGK